MDISEICRTCKSYVNTTYATDLFAKKKKYLLLQIKNITGNTLRNEKGLPKYICSVCEENVKNANSFRQTCLDVQLFFRSSKYKSKLHQKFIISRSANDAGLEKGDVQEIGLITKRESSSEYENNNDFSLTDERNSSKTSLKKEIDSEYENNNDFSLTDERNSSKTSLKKEMDTLQDPIIENEVYLDDQTNVIHSKIKNNKAKKKEAKPKNTIKNKILRHKLALSAEESEKKVGFICDQCGNHFNCRHHFLTHLRRHSNDKPFKCEICPDKFYTHSELKRHMRRHTGERPFECRYCQRRFTDYSTRIKHERTHTNERPYACTQCEKAFTSSYVLKNHMLVHTGERSFKCNLCNKAFLRQTHLTVHFRSFMHKQMLEKQTTLHIQDN